MSAFLRFFLYTTTLTLSHKSPRPHLLSTVGLRQRIGLPVFCLIRRSAMLSNVAHGQCVGLLLASSLSLGAGFLLPTIAPARQLFASSSSQKTTLHSTMSSTTPADQDTVSLVELEKKSEVLDWNKQVRLAHTLQVYSKDRAVLRLEHLLFFRREGQIVSNSHVDYHTPKKLQRHTSWTLTFPLPRRCFVLDFFAGTICIHVFNF